MALWNCFFKPATDITAAEEGQQLGQKQEAFLLPFSFSFSFSNLNEFRLRRRLDEDYGHRWVPSPLDRKLFLFCQPWSPDQTQLDLFSVWERDRRWWGGHAFAKIVFVKKDAPLLPQKKNTHQKSKTINYEYHFVHIAKTQPDTMLPFATRQKDVVKQVHNGKN